MSDELKPCPFCGKPARLVHDTHSDYASNWMYRVDCSDAACAEGVFDKEAAKAIAWWNTRAPPPPVG